MDLSNLSALVNKKESSKESVINLSLSILQPDPNQPRKSFDQTKLDELIDNIKTHGLIQPIIVRKDSDNNGHYIIVAGERRFLAFQKLGKDTIPAIVRDIDPAANIGYLQMAENLKRDDLKFYEIADFIISRVESGEKKSDIATNLGLTNRDISSYLAWQNAPEWLKTMKDRFKSVYTFYDFAKEVQDHETELKTFMEGYTEDMFTSGSLKDFKKSLNAQSTESEESNNDSLSLSPDGLAGADDFAADGIQSEVASDSPIKEHHFQDLSSNGDSNTENTHSQNSNTNDTFARESAPRKLADADSDFDGGSNSIDVSSIESIAESAENAEEDLAQIQEQEESTEEAQINELGDGREELAKEEQSDLDFDSFMESETIRESAEEQTLPDLSYVEVDNTENLKLWCEVFERKAELLYKLKPELQGCVIVCFSDDQSKQQVALDKVKLTSIEL